jgi:hypothetical protein
MSQKTLALLDRISAASTLDWRATRDEIHELHKQATTSEERGALLAIYKAVMDLAERSATISDIDKFREARQSDYNLFLIREAADEAGNIVPETLLAVTEREIAAGRMAKDDDMRRLALVGHQFIKPNDRQSSLWGKVRSLFGRQS